MQCSRCVDCHPTELRRFSDPCGSSLCCCCSSHGLCTWCVGYKGFLLHFSKLDFILTSIRSDEGLVTNRLEAIPHMYLTEISA